MNIDTHGLEMDIEQLTKVAGLTRSMPKNNQNLSYEIGYDLTTGSIYYHEFCGNVGDNWVDYKDPDVIVAATGNQHYTPQGLADKICEAAGWPRSRAEWMREDADSKESVHARLEAIKARQAEVNRAAKTRKHSAPER